jgi:hypothetical protein
MLELRGHRGEAGIGTEGPDERLLCADVAAAVARRHQVGRCARESGLTPRLSAYHVIPRPATAPTPFRTSRPLRHL